MTIPRPINGLVRTKLERTDSLCSGELNADCVTSTTTAIGWFDVFRIIAQFHEIKASVPSLVSLDGSGVMVMRGPR